MTTKRTTEYLRRNILVCAAIGARAGATAALTRLTKSKNRPQWLINMLRGVEERAFRVAGEMAVHRDEVKPVHLKEKVK